jgi:hypothetical protein
MIKNQKSISLIILYVILSLIFISLLGWILFTKSKETMTISLILYALGSLLMVISNMLFIMATNTNMLLWSSLCGIFGSGFIFGSFIYSDSNGAFVDNESIKSYGYMLSITLILALAIISGMSMSKMNSEIVKGSETEAGTDKEKSTDDDILSGGKYRKYQYQYRY